MPFLLALFISLFFPSITFGDDYSLLSEAYRPLRGSNLKDCESQLKKRSGGWCEIRNVGKHPSISLVWPKKLDQKTRMVTGPSSVLNAWNSTAFDEKRKIFYFMGGGHADYGGNEVYQFEFLTGKWERLTNPSELSHLFVWSDYSKRKNKPWRRLCWVPNVERVPASTHTYDGLLFSRITETVFLYVMGAANGSCIEDIDEIYKASPLVVGDRYASLGWYEFNPSKVDIRNGIEPLKWRRVFDSEFLRKKSISQGYPVSAQNKEGMIIFGSRFKTVEYDPRLPDSKYVLPFTTQADWGDGVKIFDGVRNIVWSLHKNKILSFDGTSGKLVKKWSVIAHHGKSIALSKDGRLYSWNGKSNVAVFDPDSETKWKVMEWGINGPNKGNSRVYGKWVYLEKEGLFAGLSSHNTGVWIYKHPENEKYYTKYSSIDAQKLINQAKSGDVVSIPPGTYQTGLFINKSLTLGLKDVVLSGTVNGKGIINVRCSDCNVVIEDFYADGVKADCLWGNCAAIKVEGKDFNLILRRAHINNTVIGLLSDNRGGSILLEDSLIENSGHKDRSSTLGHGFYAGKIDKVVIKNSIIRRSFGKGHLFKSRAVETEIVNSVIAGLDGRHSRVIDFPCGGKLAVSNSVLQQGELTDNIDLISVGTEPQSCGGSVRSSNITVRENWIIIERDESDDEPASNHGYTRLFTWRAPVEAIEVYSNRIVEKTGRFQLDGNNKFSGILPKNQLFKNRKEAGLHPKQLPDPRSQ